MHFTHAYFVLVTAMALLAPVVHSLPSKTVSKREEVSSVKSSAMVQACMDDCYRSIKTRLEERSLFDDLLQKGCIYQNRDNSNLPAECSEHSEAFKEAVVSILDGGESCRRGCLKGHPATGPVFYDGGSCYYLTLEETNKYMKGCWDAAGTSMIRNQFQDTCLAVGNRRKLEDIAFCCRTYGCAN